MRRSEAKTWFENHEIEIILSLGVVGFILLNGGFAGAAQATGKALVDAAGNVIKGGVDGIGQGFDLPALSIITTDPAVARYIIDAPNGGTFQASEYASALAFIKGSAMPAGSGTPPPANSQLATLFPPYVYQIPAVDPYYPDFSGGL